jgi:hypothetical protein
VQSILVFVASIAIAAASTVAGDAQPHSSASSSPDPHATPVVASSQALPIADFGRIVVDGKSGRVFVSSPASNEIDVLDLDGQLVKRIQGEAAPDAMVVSGATLYVTLRTAGAIDEIDTGSLLRTKTLARGLVNPTELVMAGGRLWTVSGNCGSWSVHLASVDLLTGATSLFAAPGDMSYCAAFAEVSPQRPNLVLGWSLGLSPATVTTFDVSTSKPVVLNSAREDQLGNLQDVAITPDGKSWIAASGAPYNFPEFSLATLSQDGVVYPAQNYPSAVAVADARGGVVAGGLDNQRSTNLYEYSIGAPDHTLSSDSNGREVASRGLAFDPQATRIFEVTWDHFSAVTFNVLPTA